MGRILLSRRRFVVRTAMSFGALSIAGCDALGRSQSFRGVLDSAESLTMRSQRLLLSGQSLAREYAEKDRSPIFRANGTSMPRDPEYQELLAGGFADWRLRIDGLVGQPASYSLEELRKLPARTQITRHDCVEGWSAIGGWTGFPSRCCCAPRGAKLRLATWSFIVSITWTANRRRAATNAPGAITNPSIWSMRFIRRRYWPMHSMASRCRSKTVLRCACGSSGSSDTNTPSI